MDAEIKRTLEEIYNTLKDIIFEIKIPNPNNFFNSFNSDTFKIDVLNFVPNKEEQNKSKFEIYLDLANSTVPIFRKFECLEQLYLKLKELLNENIEHEYKNLSNILLRLKIVLKKYWNFKGKILYPLAYDAFNFRGYTESNKFSIRLNSGGKMTPIEFSYNQFYQNVSEELEDFIFDIGSIKNYIFNLRQSTKSWLLKTEKSN
jgi:hypothetical protein